MGSAGEVLASPTDPLRDCPHVCRIQLLIPASASPWMPRVQSLRFWHRNRAHLHRSMAALVWRVAERVEPPSIYEPHKHTHPTRSRRSVYVETFEGSIRRRCGRWCRWNPLWRIVVAPRGEALQTIFGRMDLITVAALFLLDAANWRWSLVSIFVVVIDAACLGLAWLHENNTKNSIFKVNKSYLKW